MSEASGKLSREDMARVEVGQTDITPVMARVFSAVFLLTVLVVPLTQLVREYAAFRGGRRQTLRPDCLEIFEAFPRAADAYAESQRSFFWRLLAANRALLQHINRYEDRLSDGSWLTKSLLPPAQAIVARFGVGNEQAYIGRDGWAFYRPGIDYVVGAGFLDPRRLARRAASGNEWVPAPQPDPRKAILQFHKQLEQRGIQLIVFPTPIKPVIHPDRFSVRYEGASGPVRNLSFREFKRDLQARGVVVYDPADRLYVRAHTYDGNLMAVRYLWTDTHWNPQAMEFVAEDLARHVTKHLELSARNQAAYKRVPDEVSNLGDVARMLQLPEGQALFVKQGVEIQQVLTAQNELWRPSRSADVLVLGDSYSNVFSLDGMGWGASAGFVEQLGFHLKRPLDAILRNDDGAHATRKLLSQELAAGRDRLEGKKLVIWQFAERELAVGDWKLLDMTLGTPSERRFFVPEAGKEVVITGVVAAASGVPRPGSVVYRDHVMAVHVTEMTDGQGHPRDTREAVVYLLSMRDNKWTSAARLRAGQEIRLRLQGWSEVEDKYGRIRRSDLEDDEELMLAEPCWGEVLKP